jgi:uncharacterized protein (DUF362 family)
MKKSVVYIVSTDDRAHGSRRCLEYFKLPDYTGKTVFVKPNFNTADPAPGSTHNDTLSALLGAVREKNPSRIILGERSGPTNTADVFEAKGIAPLCGQFGAELLNLEELDPGGWVEIDRPGLHWPKGLMAPRALIEADASVATCCLKTHAYGGVFSNSLKLAVGLTPKDFSQLHNSPDMRAMIAEINLAYTPDLVLCDAVEVFTDGGPMHGVRNNAGLMFAGSDRVALDAVGLAILKSIGSNSAIMDKPIFRQDQIVRAVELGLGIGSAADIQLVTDDEASAEAIARVQMILLNG